MNTFFKKMGNRPWTLINKMAYLIIYSLSFVALHKTYIWSCLSGTPKDHTQTSVFLLFLLLLWEASLEVLHHLTWQCPSNFFQANLGTCVSILEFILPYADSSSSSWPKEHLKKNALNGLNFFVLIADISYLFYEYGANGDYIWNTVWLCGRHPMILLETKPTTPEAN